MNKKSRQQAIEELSLMLMYLTRFQDNNEFCRYMETSWKNYDFNALEELEKKERIAKAPELFLVAVDRSTGKLAGFLNGLATDEYTFRDEFFTDANLYNPAGKNIMLLGLDVLPEYRRQGIAKELVYSYARRERENGRQTLILTCLKSKVKMYEKMRFVDRGIANSTWGGEEWHEMIYRIGI
jgi:ribosomal protein S18 acetylase RimI-like enzyme